MKYIVALAILGSLVLLSSCGDQLPTDIPDVYGYQGYLDLGWAAYEDAKFDTAYKYFADAIDFNVHGIEAYVGAGWSSLFVFENWRIADDYFYMAIQFDAGVFPMMNPSESQVQDTMWTVFECLHPDLPPAVLDPILELTADSGIVWVGDQIEAIIGETPIQYRFVPVYSNTIAIFNVVNGYSTTISPVDSISGGYVYMTAPYAEMDVGGNYHTWVSVDNQMNYDYRTFIASGNETQYTYDALAGSAMLQDIRGENGDGLLGCAAAVGLDQISDPYNFGAGKDYEALEVISNTQLMGTGAAIAFANQAFNYSWFVCLTEGYGTTLDPSDPAFVVQLFAVIEEMLGM